MGFAATKMRRGSALATNLEYLDLGDVRPLWLSADGVTLWCSNGKSLVKSTDDLATPPSAPIWTLPVAGTNTAIHAIRETADGFLLVSCFKLQGNYAGLWRVNPNDGSATEVLTPSGQVPVVADPATFPSPMGTSGDRSNYFTGWFGFHTYPDGRVIVNEYGKQANGSSIPGARHVLMSGVGGNGRAGTWQLVRDFWGGPPYTSPGNVLPFGSPTFRDHMHGAVLDPTTNLIWFTGGDNGHHTEYADADAAAADPYNAHGTWHVTPASAPFLATMGNLPDPQPKGAQPGTTQAVTPFVLPDRILIGTDGPIDGLVSIEKSDPTYGTLLELHGLGLPHDSQLKYTMATPYQRTPQHPVLFPFYVGSGGVRSFPGVIVACDPLGQRFYDIWVDNQSLQNPYGVLGAFGPTARGKLIATINADGRAAGQVPVGFVNQTVLRADFPDLV